MNKKDKVIAIRIPARLFDKFKSKCNEECIGMSEAIRFFIRDFNNDGIACLPYERWKSRKRKEEDDSK